MRLNLLRLLVSLGVVVIVGCAGPQVSGSADAKSLATHAVVIISVTSDEETGQRAEPIFYVDSGPNYGALDKRILRSIEKVLGIPVRSDFDEVYGQVYVLEMEPGSHKVDGWQIYSAGTRIFPLNPVVPLTFDVKAGEVVYLGNLNMNHQLARGFLPGLWVATSGTPEVRDRSSIDVPIAEKKVPSLRDRVTTRLLPIGTWGSPNSTANPRADPIFLPPPIPAKK